MSFILSERNVVSLHASPSGRCVTIIPISPIEGGMHTGSVTPTKGGVSSVSPSEADVSFVATLPFSQLLCSRDRPGCTVTLNRIKLFLKSNE